MIITISPALTGGGYYPIYISEVIKMARKNKNAGQNPSKKNGIFSGKKLDKATRARIEKQLAESRERDIRAMQEKNKKLAEKRMKSQERREAKRRTNERYSRITERDFRAKLWEKYPSLALDPEAKKPKELSDEDWQRYKDIQQKGKTSHERYQSYAKRLDPETMKKIRAMPSEEVEEYFDYLDLDPMIPLEGDENMEMGPFENDADTADRIDQYIKNYIKSL